MRRLPLRLVDLVHHRWAVPLLALLFERDGAKFVTLAHHLGLSRDSLSRTLAALAERDLVARNPGHGHPLRPEWILTPAGRRLGPWCVRLRDRVAALGLEDLGFRKWSLPCVEALAGGGRGFSELARALGAISPRALTLALGGLEGEGLVARRVAASATSQAVYALTPTGRRLAPALAGRPGARPSARTSP